ncbi:MAG: ABC transporter permease [Phycisphaerae bacterium]
MNNPIVRRELIGVLRKSNVAALQVAWIAVLALVMILRWPVNGRVNLAGTQAQQVLSLLSWTILVGVMLVAPAFPAASVVAEKRSGTLALLLNSPLSTAAIFRGKLIGALGLPIILMLLTIPAMTACFAMGGVSLLHQVLPLYLIFSLVAVESAAVGLYLSIRANNVDSAIRLTYAVLFVLDLLLLIPYRLVANTQIPYLVVAGRWLASFSPLPAMLHVLGANSIHAGNSIHGGNSVIVRFVICSLALSAVLGLLSIRRLGQWLFDRPRDSGKITDDRSTQVRAYRRIMYLWFFDPQRRSGLIGPLSNPVMVKEFRTSRFGRSHWMMRLVGICLIVSLGLMLAAAYGSISFKPRTLGELMVLFQVTLIVLITPSLASGLISSEIQNKTWQLLRVTPLSATAIVLGKLLSVCRTLLLLLLATLPGYAVMLVIDKGQADRVVTVLITLGLIALFCLLVSSAISSWFRKTAQATAVSYMLLLALFGGTLVFWAGRGTLFSLSLVAGILKFNPLAAALSTLHAPGFNDYNFVRTNWWFMLVVMGIATVILIFRTWRLTRPD